MAAKEIIISPAAAIRDFPVIGDDLSQIGQAVQIMVDCQPASATLYIYGLWHQFPTLITSLVKPEMFDVNIGGKRHRKRRGRGLRFFIDQLFRGTITEYKVPRWAIFQLGEAVQRIGWYLMVLDASSDFVVNWTSMVYQWNGCDAVPLSPRFTMQREDLLVYRTTGGWERFIQGVVVDEFEAEESALLGAVEVLENCFPRFSIEFVPKVWPPEPNVQFRGVRIMRSDKVDPVWTWDPQDPRADGGGISDATAPGDFMPAGTLVWLETNVTAGGIGLQSMKFQMFSSNTFPDLPLGPDP